MSYNTSWANHPSNPTGKSIKHVSPNPSHDKPYTCTCAHLFIPWYPKRQLITKPDRERQKNTTADKTAHVAASALASFFGAFSFLGAAFLGAAAFFAAAGLADVFATRPDLVLLMAAGLSAAAAGAYRR
jgi:hypothetical protein